MDVLEDRSARYCSRSIRPRPGTGIWIPALALLILLAVGCGRGRSGVAELPFVPRTVLLHIHCDSTPPDYLVSAIPASTPVRWSTLVEAMDGHPFGVSLLAIDISDLSPQLLLLVQGVDGRQLSQLLSENTRSEARAVGDRTDLLQSGSPWASVASRDGWTAVYIGGAPEIVVRNWLEMDAASSLASDTALVSLLPDEPALGTVLIPGNMLTFLDSAPVSRWLPYWNRVEQVLSFLNPRAMVIGVDLDPAVRLELFVARASGSTSRLALEIEDEALQAAIPGLLQLLSMGRL